MNKRGRSVRLFMVDGTPGGLLTAEIMNWTGRLVSGPRSELAAIINRPEAAATGIYLLLGEDPTTPDRPMVYIGESVDISKRLLQHETKKDF